MLADKVAAQKTMARQKYKDEKATEFDLQQKNNQLMDEVRYLNNLERSRVHNQWILALLGKTGS